MFKNLNSLKLFICWWILLFIISVIVVPVLFATTVGGEQSPLTFLVKTFLLGVYGSFLLLVVTPFFYYTWFKKHWYIHILLCCFFGYNVVIVQREIESVKYGIKNQVEEIGGDKIESKKEYYSFEPERIRSESYWKNGLEDSIWVIYAKDGSIINKKEYKKGVLVR